MMQKAIHAAVTSSGFDEASDSLLVLAEAKISACRLRRLTQRIGNERMAQVDQQTADYHRLPFPVQQQCPIANAPDVACIESDGGRIQILDRHAPDMPDQPTEGRDNRAGHWRETKVATLLKMQSKMYSEDPCPTIPEVFVSMARMQRLSREIKGFSAQPSNNEAVASAPLDTFDDPKNTPLSANELHTSTRPRVILRSVQASMRDIHQFGKQLVAAAYARGFHAAARRAFVCDGMACNWTLHQKYFSSYTPILDFVHALCYVYHAAMAGQTSEIAWGEYCRWAQWLWSGEIKLLIAAINQRLQSLDTDTPDDSESSPRSKVATALNYLKNQSTRVNYPKYRQQGLPITSAHIESTIKRMNHRVKGTEKFWSINASPILQLRADHLSETQPMKKFWRNRSQLLPLTARYKTAT